MGTLGTLCAIVPATIQKVKCLRNGLIVNYFETRHHYNKYIFCLKFVRQLRYNYVPHIRHLFVDTVLTKYFPV